MLQYQASVLEKLFGQYHVVDIWNIHVKIAQVANLFLTSLANIPKQLRGDFVSMYNQEKGGYAMFQYEVSVLVPKGSFSNKMHFVWWS